MLSLSSRGYRAIAPDLRGYGDTDAPPSSSSSYTAFHIVGDLVGLLDSLGLDRVLPGGATTGGLLLPGISACSGPIGNLERQRKNLLELTPEDCKKDDVNYYAAKFNQKGFTGGLNYYRALDLTWEQTAPWTGLQIKVPVKFVVGDEDVTYTTPGVKEYIHDGAFKSVVPLLEELVVMEGVGYFLNEEKPEEISAHIYDFIRGLLSVHAMVL
ncbi:alpha/beta-Hydrolases superfamily protein [Actinidia rufa]|uniref:Alpha/beta-Hydrolases superfamily protein n=1 Tax=Actinidia rufa TaxID=165716 RepID=A0A7J0GT12_9ERIC|nr:alpha/beta-Hydrolases superfamily protein [Actinidia rufa]